MPVWIVSWVFSREGLFFIALIPSRSGGDLCCVVELMGNNHLVEVDLFVVIWALLVWGVICWVVPFVCSLVQLMRCEYRPLMFIRADCGAGLTGRSCGGTVCHTRVNFSPFFSSFVAR